MKLVFLKIWVLKEMETEEFIKLTLDQPEFIRVLSSETSFSYIFIQSNLVKDMGLVNFLFAVGRLNNILLPAEILVTLENCSMERYKLCMERIK